MEQTDLNSLVADNLKLIPYIRAQQNSLRLIGAIPTWENFAQTEAFRDFIREGFTPQERRKYKAVWDLIWTLCRDKKDLGTVQLAFAYLLQESYKRSYTPNVPPVIPQRYGITDQQHWMRVKEYVLSNYENFIPK
jgi:hypothetical protein